MAKITQSLKTWYKVASPNKTIWFFTWVTAVIPSICGVISAIPAANVITSLNIADYKGAMIQLCIVFAIDLIAQLSWEFEYRLSINQLGYVYPRIQERLFQKVFNADEANFKYTSKEKMVNTITNNIVTLSDFCDYSAYKSAYLIRAVVTLAIIFSTNILIGLLIFGVAILVFFLIKLLNALIGKKTNEIYEERDKLTETFADMVDNRHLSQDLNLGTQLHEKYFNRVDKIVKNYKKRTHLKSLRDNWVYLLYTFIILLATLYLVKLVSDNVVTLSLYFVITPYLTAAITKMTEFFGLFNDLENTSIAALRVKTLLDMSEKDMIEFGKNSTDKIEGAITFSNVSYSSEDKIDKSLGNIKILNTQIAKNQIVLIEGTRNCGKRAIFYMLRRAVRPDSGTITLDTINIYDFDVETYKHNMSYATSKPYFFNDTIMENLKFVEQNKKKIFEACKKVGVHDTIMALPEGYQTNLSVTPNALNLQQKFLLGLARALLTKSEVFMVYEFPIGLSDKEQATIKKLLSKLKSERTIIVFSALNPIDDILDKHYFVEKGNVKELSTGRVKVNKQPLTVDSNYLNSV